MHMPLFNSHGSLAIRALTGLALLVASGLEAQTSKNNPVLRRKSLPAYTEPNALRGLDRADLRKKADLEWFGVQTAEYLDYRNKIATEQAQLWRHMLPRGQAAPAKGVAMTPPGVGGTWVNLGPTANVTDASWTSIDSGRPVAIVTHPTVTTTLYLATSGGGVFKCTNADVNAAGDWTWTSITDDLPTSSSSGNVSVGALAMSPSDSNTLYLGAGDHFDAQARGFYRTTDGGATWIAATAGLGNATRSHAILPLSGTRILWGTDDGLKVSTDGGSTFSPAAGGPSAGDVWSVQKLSATEVVCSVQNSSGVGTIHYSSNGGDTWTQAAFPAAITFGVGRVTVTAAGNGNTVYAILEDSATGNIARGVLRSTDKGVTWTWMAAPTATGSLFQGTGNQMSSDGGQGFYNHLLAVNPANPDQIVVGANLAMYRSLDGGATWGQLSHWYGSQHPYAHADTHTAAWSGGTLFVGNDGGISVVKEPWRATLPSAQEDLTFIDNRRNKGLVSHLIYNIGSTTAASPADSRYRITVGLQDNGTRVRQGSGAALQTSGIFEDQIGGDGFGTVIHPTNGNLMLGSLYYTRIYKSSNGGGSFASSSTGITESNSSSNAPFAPKLYLGATSLPDSVFTFVNKKVYKSTDFGGSWTSMTMTDFTASGKTIRNFVASRRTDGVVGIASNSGLFWTTYNNGTTWTNAGDVTGGSFNTSYMWFNTENDQIVYGATVAPSATAHHLFKSQNGGASWVSIDGQANASNGLPFGIPIHVVQNLPGSLNTLFVGTDMGVYRSLDGGATWSRFGNNMPMVAVRDLYIAPDGTFIRAATFGRGVWELTLQAPGPSFDVNVDGAVDAYDLLDFLKRFGSVAAGDLAKADFSGDSQINDTDLTALLGAL